jgi:hypothetical protein
MMSEQIPLKKRIPFDQTYAHWFGAVLRAQESGKLDEIAGLLRSKIEIRPQERWLLARLCERRALKRKRGRQLTPVGKSSHKARLMFMAEQVHDLQTGETRWQEEVLPEEAAEWRQELVFESAETRRRYVKNAQRIRKLRDKNGRMRRDDAIDLVARKWGIDPSTLADSLNRKSGASRGGWKRWPAKRAAKASSGK